MYQRVGSAAFKKDLTNIIALCEQLGQPHQQFKSIHIAGTNGKGSSAHMLAAILQAQGYKVGLYTSPHYKDFRERVKVNGSLMPESYVTDFVEQHKDAFEQIQPSFFEITVAMAFDYFAKAKVDIAVIEVGLGGRLDSTNIIQPIVSVITNISFDHQQFLGNTLKAIAGEKAGIIKEKIPVVVGETHPETKEVFLDKAKAFNAEIVFADQHYEVVLQEDLLDTTLYKVYRNGKEYYDKLEVQVRGPYQYKNLQTVFQLLELLPTDVEVSEAAIIKGLNNVQKLTYFIGRWQLLGTEPVILCDSAHNEAGLQYMQEGLNKIPHRQLHMVIGMVADKDVSKALSMFPVDAQYYFAKPAIPRGLDQNKLLKYAQEAGLSGMAYESVGDALAAAKTKATRDDLIYVGGSIFVVAEVI
ncbi:MAG: bifunctional folylpolyglutamate synthase/dihydrofolate synthase [Chitinophagales bacterium]|nr:bifunctional folylpolyglutamate synthase/dihydrofolate synthase [Chitinophagales bacterium]